MTTKITEEQKRADTENYVMNHETGRMVLKKSTVGRKILGLKKNNVKQPDYIIDKNGEKLYIATVVEIDEKKESFSDPVEAELVNGIKELVVKEDKSTYENKLETEICLQFILDKQASGSGGDKYICVDNKSLNIYLDKKYSRKDGNILSSVGITLNIDSNNYVPLEEVKQKESNNKNKSEAKSQTIIYNIQSANIEKVDNIRADNVTIKKNAPAMSVD